MSESPELTVFKKWLRSGYTDEAADIVHALHDEFCMMCEKKEPRLSKREYLNKRFPHLAGELDKIPDRVFGVDDFNWEEFYDDMSSADVIEGAFIWSVTPQGLDFWVSVWKGHGGMEKYE